MTFRVILLSFACSGFGIVVHWAWWKLARPSKDVPALAGCVVLIPCALAAFGGTRIAFFSNEEFWALLLLSALHGIHYVMLYPAWQAGSPTVLVVLKLGKEGPSSASELTGKISEELVCEGTLHRLLNEKWMAQTAEGFHLDKRGRLLTGLCGTWRRLLGLPDGPG